LPIEYKKLVISLAYKRRGNHFEKCEKETWTVSFIMAKKKIFKTIIVSFSNIPRLLS